MSYEKATLARARLAMRKVRRFLRDPNVNLIDFGYREQGGETKIDDERLTIRFHMNEKFRGPELEAAQLEGRTNADYSGLTVDGFTIDIIAAPHRLQAWPRWGRGWSQPKDPRATAQNPMLGGISISNEYHYTYGTLGGLVFDRHTHAELLLSNWHVLIGDWRLRWSRLIYQPGRLDGGTHADTVAIVERSAMQVNLDAAVARLTGARSVTNDQLELEPVTGTAWAYPGMHVVKSGRASKITRGIITGIEGTAMLRYAGQERTIRNVMTIVPRGIEVSRGGDSGSFWLDENNKRVVGLHFAGSDFPEQGLAMDILPVLDALEVYIPQA